MQRALVAIVDDDPRIQDLLSAELGDLQQPHCSYSSAEALLAELELRQPGLILLDVLMPGMGGMGCLRELRQRGYTGTVVMFSALNDPELKQKAEAEGASGWVVKSTLFDQLQPLLRHYLPDN